MIVYKLQSTQEILPVFPDLSADSHDQLNCDKSSKRLDSNVHFMYSPRRAGFTFPLCHPGQILS